MMKNNRLVRWSAGLLLAATIGAHGAHAQPAFGSGVAASSPAMIPAQTKREMRKADRLLAKQVRRELVRVKGLDSSRIVAVARGGQITLGGSVPEADQIGLAMEAAKHVSGVSEVTNSLNVKAPGQ
ncbi:hypothetical protein LMG28688_02716 [Paraburkholderia caffeinitolerans]|uniref:BON domain-containing protein n=1 Tax=Paraburkholderia caffeinitolerans TaxID=1723730 RepID=A0A6J5FX75_9BURK|nr:MULTISPECIES: BON domain-containing protein [Paraburkholderia]CAB3788579.1 hypothetical protein LMG28688_02716 [Paraburkholderia caffeinitolerans]